MRARHQRKSSNILIPVGLVLVILGSFLMVSVLDLSNLKPGDLTYRGPIGELTTDSFSPDEQKRIFVGFLILSGGILALIKSR